MLKVYPHHWVYQQIGNASSDAFVASDRNGIIRLWNSGAEAIFGFEPSEAVGQPLDLIMPEKLCARHWEGYRMAMETGAIRCAAKLLEAPARRKDGTSISIEFSMALIRDEAGEMVGTAAIIRDVSSRWMKENVLKERLLYLEERVRKEGLVD